MYQKLCAAMFDYCLVTTDQEHWWQRVDQVRNLFGASSNICDQAFHAITAGLKSQVWVPNGALAATEENTSAT